MKKIKTDSKHDVRKVASSSKFLKLNESLNKIFSNGSLMTENKFSKIDEWINTGNYILNAQISGSLFGGIPNSRSVLLSGDSGVGKSFLVLNICREAQKMGYSIIYCDSEAAVDEDVLIRFGIDPSGVRYQPVSTVQEFSNFVNNLTKQLKQLREEGQELPKILLALDSLGNLASEKEKDDVLKGNNVVDMTKQKAIRSLFRTITMDLADLKIPFVITNHTYQTIGMFATKEISGGGGVIFNPSVILMLSKAKLKEDTEKNDDMKSTGIVVTSTVVKNRFSKPINVRFHISFFKGMNKFVGLEKYISWENCGIERGKLYTESEFKKVENSIDKSSVFEFERNGEKYFFVKKDTARNFVAKHLCKEVEPKRLFTDEVFTEEVLRQLDENVIKKLFQLPSIDDLENMNDMEDIDDVV